MILAAALKTRLARGRLGDSVGLSVLLLISACVVFLGS